VQALQTDGTSITEIRTILHTVHMLSTESLASKCDNKNKNLVTQMMDDIYEEEYKK